MNERIKALSNQAVDYALSVCDANGVYQGKEYLTVVKEKFAELLIRECIAVHLDDYGVDIIGDVLKKHFGVDE